jgi:two-component system sensor kinase FixL
MREHQAELARVSRLSVAGEMASALAHELNQPLTAIMAYARGCMHLLADPTSDRELTREAFEEVIRQTDRAGTIINRLREFLRQGTSHRSTVPVVELIEEALELARAEATQNGVEIRAHLAPDLPSVLVDRVQIEQVIINLVRNAVEAMVGADTRVREILIEARPAPEGVELVISDTGPGISGEVAARLFEPFITTKPRGMGLGLPISRSIAEAHGGHLQLADGSTGAAFSLMLPTGRAGDDDAR